MFRRALGRRILPNIVYYWLAWPLATAISATIDLKSQSATARLPWSDTFLMLLRAEVLLASDYFFVGAALAATSVLLFSSLALVRREPAAPPSARWRWLEPLVCSAALFSGIACEYPTVLAHPFLLSLRPAPIGMAIALLALVSLGMALLLGIQSGGARGGAAWAAGTAALVLVAWGFGRTPAARRSSRTPAGSVVVLGIDSLSQSDDLSALRRFTMGKGGAWYTHAVTPGLLTNAVWTSILEHRPVRETGVWEIFMANDWSKAPYSLVREAKRAGFTTFSYFSDQFTTYVGTEAGFDVDRSGPMGWLQLATATLKNDSVFLPLVLSRMPPLPGARTPRNQSGTFAFDVAADLDDTLTTAATTLSSSPPRPGRAFSAGHLDYLHQPLYPRFSELAPAERRVVLRSRVESAQDFSVDWQYPKIPGDALDLYRWKIGHVQRLVAEAVDRTRFLDPALGNRLVLFSDHGNRKNLDERNFANPVFWNVLFATFGVTARDAEAPISLLDIPELLGIPDPSRPGPAAPAVQFAGINERESAQLSDAYFVMDGRIVPNPGVMAGIGRRIREYRPFTEAGVYFPAPAP